MTARLLRVLENPEKIFSTSLLAFSFINRPNFVKNPVWPAEHLNRAEPVRQWVVPVGGAKKMNCGWEEGLEITEKRGNEAEVVAISAATVWWMNPKKKKKKKIKWVWSDDVLKHV